ncbi:PaaI family thioesterase [Tsukamurella sp. 1534]|uniref:PaaI family thioesterase n=1 Tax=Tsukamurella sp. 1534 TaxID=1151061 RepID=UPI0002E2B3FA|nr:hotdog fold domain-containing protein [Tsukamurella sp. 1534]
MTDADPDKVDLRSEIPRFKEATPPPEFGDFVENMRRLQDLAVSIDAPDEVYAEAKARTAELIDLLAPHEAREGKGPANRSMQLPGRGSLLMPPWKVEKFDEESVVARGILRRYHLGGGGVAHGGVLPLIFDDNFGMVVYAAKRPISRTAYLHVNYRKVTPLNVPLVIEGRVDRVDGRKTFITSRLTEEDGTLLADGEGLMLQLLPGQP